MTQQLTSAYPKLPATVYRRTVFLGDSITDGNTYPSLVPDALRQAGLERMTAINAGIGGNTAAEMAARLERDVLVHRPTLVTFSSGGNDAARGVSPEQFEQDVRGIIECIRAQQIPMILLTTVDRSTIHKRPVAAVHDRYDEAFRRLAGAYELRLAEVGARMHEDAEAGHAQLAPDGHPGYQGQRMIAHAVLDAMGYGEVPVPERPYCELQPGVIERWQLHPAAPHETPLSEQTAASLVPDQSWVALTLPQTEPITGDENLWLDDYRRQGMATELKKWVAGDTESFIGVTTLHSAATHTVNFHTGATLSKIWLNGKLIYQNTWQHGWHAGRQSVSAELQEGDNRVVIETGEHFFLSVTSGDFWG